MKEERSGESHPLKLWGGLLASLLLAILAMWAWREIVVDQWAWKARPKDAGGSELRNYSVPGAFGDAFAPIVGLMSSLALGAAIASLFLQRRELALQRTALAEQRAEMQESNKAFHLQYEVMQRQAELQGRANKLSELSIEAMNRANVVADVAARIAAVSEVLAIDRLGPDTVIRTIGVVPSEDQIDEFRQPQDVIWMRLASLQDRRTDRVWRALASGTSEVETLLRNRELLNGLLEKINRPKAR